MTTYSFEPTQAPMLVAQAGERGNAHVGGPGSTSAVVPGGDPPSTDRNDFEPLILPELGLEAGVVDEPQEEGPSLEHVLAEARAAGRREGVEEGRRAEMARLVQSIEAVKGLMDGIESAAAAREQEARARVVLLATGIATHLLEREVRTAPDVIADLVRKAIAEFPVRDPLRVHLNPSDLAILSTGLDQESGRGQLTRGQSVRWIPDPEIRSGGCLVEGPERIIDARLSTTVERIWKVLGDG